MSIYFHFTFITNPSITFPATHFPHPQARQTQLKPSIQSYKNSSCTKFASMCTLNEIIIGTNYVYPTNRAVPIRLVRRNNDESHNAKVAERQRIHFLHTSLRKFASSGTTRVYFTCTPRCCSLAG